MACFGASNGPKSREKWEWSGFVLKWTTLFSSLQYCPFHLKHPEDILVLVSSSVIREEEKKETTVRESACLWLWTNHIFLLASRGIVSKMKPRLPSMADIIWVLMEAPQPSSSSNYSCSGQFSVSADSCCSDGATSSMGHVILLPGPGSSLIGGNWLTPLKSASWNLGELVFWGQPSASGEQEP